MTDAKDKVVKEVSYPDGTREIFYKNGDMKRFSIMDNGNKIKVSASHKSITDEDSGAGKDSKPLKRVSEPEFTEKDEFESRLNRIKGLFLKYQTVTDELFRIPERRKALDQEEEELKRIIDKIKKDPLMIDCKLGEPFTPYKSGDLFKLSKSK
jgi:hypothetical protein